MKKTGLVVKFKVLFSQFTVEVNDNFFKITWIHLVSTPVKKKKKSNEAEPIQLHYLHPFIMLARMHTLTHASTHTKRKWESVFIYSLAQVVILGRGRSECQHKQL